MGAWSHQPFGNDDAMDWAHDLDGVDDLSLIEAALDQAIDADDYLELPDGANAVAAVEVLAKLLGRGTQTDSYTRSVDEWVQSVALKPDAKLLSKARRALRRVLAEDSELKEVWEDAGSAEWVESIRALENAIGRA